MKQQNQFLPSEDAIIDSMEQILRQKAKRIRQLV